ncbi:glutamylcysteine synthetase [Actinoplanes sp. NPDC051343]|uniref:glutamylcysteine synthetase n=1 Tax=Actinoplanes sp. NPDC051343 TaxID=3363906 RepID=UPI0037B1AEED
MGRLTESAAEQLIAARAFNCGPPGFVGAALDRPGRAGLPRQALRHGFLISRAGGVVTVSGPPSPGLESSLTRMAEDLAALRGSRPGRSPGSRPENRPGSSPDSWPENRPGNRPGRSPGSWLGNSPGNSPGSWPGGGAAAGIRVGLESGLDGGGPLGLPRRWRLAHTLAPVLAAAFANSPSNNSPSNNSPSVTRPSLGGRWRSVRAARYRDRPVLPHTAVPPPPNPCTADLDPRGHDEGAGPRCGGEGTHPSRGGEGRDPSRGGEATGPRRGGEARDPRRGGEATDLSRGGEGADPRASWAASVMDTAVGDRTFREWTRSDDPPTEDDLARHLDTLTAPVQARGHLELDFADGQDGDGDGDGWRVAVAVIATLLDDPVAATAAERATGHFAYAERVWEIAARDALTDARLAAAARECFVAAYAALGRRGAPRDLRDAVAAFTERYVMRGRCPADDRIVLPI